MKKLLALLAVLCSATVAFAQDHEDDAVLSVGLLSAAGLTPVARAKTPVASHRPVENVTPVASDRQVDPNVGDLQMVAEFEQQVVGVAVSASGRVFVSFPGNGIDPVKTSVMEVINRKAVAYPNEEINTLNTAAPSTHFLSAQSVYVDSSDTLWVLDVGNLGSGTALISGGAKLVAIDLTTNAVKRTIVFPDSLITKGTSINDVRFDLARGRAGFAYIPDSSAAAGSGIIVVDLSTGNAVRRLAHDPTVLPDPAFRATVEGKPFVIQATVDAAPSLVSVAAAGIAGSADGRLVYYCPIASRNLYSVDAAVLTEFTQSDAAGDAVRAEGPNRNFTESVTGKSRLHFFVRLLSLLCEEHS